MTPSGIYRDIVSLEQTSGKSVREGRSYVAVIGIDRYRSWSRLYNAVSDARGALRLFTRMGFQLVAPALLDERATADALRQLVIDDLFGLGADDSLVLFFAGHGHTVARRYGDTSVRDGYLIPADGDLPGGRATTWIRLESWLTEITRIPAKHILVILDACHSGLALGPILQWRSRGIENARREPLEQLRVRRSRRIITSALDDQLAMDGGPVPGHSLFTGCLIEAMTGGIAASMGHQIVTGSEIGHYVQRRVSEYPGSRQTPDFGALELDDRGELVVQLSSERARLAQAPSDDPTIQDIGFGNESRITAPVPSSDPIANVAFHRSEPLRSGKLPSRAQRRHLYWGIGGGMIMVAGAVVLLIARSGASPENTRSRAPNDAAGSVVMSSDAPFAVTTPDAKELDFMDASVTPEMADSDKPSSQRPGRRVDDGNSPESNRPAIDDRGN